MINIIVMNIKSIIVEVISVTQGINIRCRQEAETLAISVVLASRSNLTQLEIQECIIFIKVTLDTYYNYNIADIDKQKESA